MCETIFSQSAIFRVEGGCLKKEIFKLTYLTRKCSTFKFRCCFKTQMRQIYFHLKYRKLLQYILHIPKLQIQSIKIIPLLAISKSYIVWRKVIAEKC